MNSSRFSLKRTGRTSSKSKFKEVSAFDMFYQLTYLSAMSSAGITRRKTFEIAAQSISPVAQYFVAVNTLVDEFRLDYPEACRVVGEKAKSNEVRSFLLRLADALRSGEPLPDFLAREAEVQGDNYSNAYERDVESLKKWSDAFSSMIVSVALIVIIQLVSSMIYSMETGVMAGLIATGVIMGFFGAWIISRAAPQEETTIASSDGSVEQRRALKLFRLLAPLIVGVATIMLILGAKPGWLLIVMAVLMIPLGIVSLISDKKVVKRDEEFSTFLRSAGGMATSTGSTLKQALTKIDLSSFPTLRADVERLNTRLLALVSPETCWHLFGLETGSRLISEATDIFYGAIMVGGDPERVGYLCSLFTARTSQLRAKRRIVSSTFAGLTLVMQGVVAALMVFVLEIIRSFVRSMEAVLTPDQTDLAAESIALPMATFSSSQLQFLSVMTVSMVILLAVISAIAIIASDGGYKFKMAFYMGIALLVSGLSFLIVPSLAAGILTA